MLTVSAATLVSIAVTPANPSVAKGLKQQFTATGTYTDSTTLDLTSIAVWASATPAVATINVTGLASTLTIGTTTISATSGSVSGSTVLTVSAATLVSIAVTPANPSIAKGLTQQFTATGTFTDSTTQNLTTSVTWASATTSVATINTTGAAFAAGIGTSTISATSGSVSGSTVLTVSAATLVSIAVTPANSTVANGTNPQFTATGSYTDSSTQNLTGSVTWASSSIGVATISGSGLATTHGQGTTTISATSGSVVGTTLLNVTTAQLLSIAVTPANPSVAKGLKQQFTATGTYSDSSTLDLTSSVTWASATLSVATINTAGLASTLTIGTTTISATSGSVSGSTVLTVSAATLVSIAVTPANPSVAVGATPQFTATGTYTDSTTADLTSSVTWASSNAGVATISSAGKATALAVGSTTISATSGTVVGSTVLTVTSGTTSVVVGSTLNPSTYGQSVSFTVSVSSTSGGATPTGSVQFQVDGLNLGSSVILVGGSVTSMSINTLSAGPHNVVANYLGDGTYSPNSGSTIQQVNKAGLTLVADNLRMNHFDAVPTLTYHLNGFVLGENPASAGVISSASLTTTATSSSAAGYYPIHVGSASLSANNYTLAGTLDGIMTVAPKVMDARVWFGPTGTNSMSLLGLTRDLPFINIKAIDVLFSDDVAVNQSMLQLLGVNVANYSTSGFSYNPATHHATWNLPTAIGVDRLMLSLSGPAAPPVVGTGPDITINPFADAFSVLPGDVNGDGIVTTADIVDARNDQASLGGTYVVWADVNGDGVIDMNDLLEIRKRIGSKLP